MKRVLTAMVIALGLTAPTPGTWIVWAAVPPTIDTVSVRAAKTALAWFLLDNVDRPLRVTDPCPTLPSASAAAALTEVGLVPSAREYGTAVVWDTDVGAGLVAVRCGVDIARSADPAGSVGWSMDVATLDGQATFAQYAVAVAGNDAIVAEVTEVGGSIVSRCSNSGRSCTTALTIDGLLFTLRLVGLPADTGESLSRQLLVTVAPEIVANLTSILAAP